MPKGASSPSTAVTVLLIDPHPICLLGLEHLLSTDPNITVCGTTASYKKGLQLAKQLEPNVILLDPLLESPEGIALITQFQEACSSKIIVLTSSSKPQAHDQAILLGARGILQKTEPSDTYLKAIQCVQEGELWLNRHAASRILKRVTTPTPTEKQPPQASLLQNLTKQEDRICRTIQASADKTLKEIASGLNISENTLRNHLAAIYTKLAVRNRMELYVFCNKYQKTGDGQSHPKRRASDT
jgi:two-component system nitrate/nitrite response regulator NarL